MAQRALGAGMIVPRKRAMFGLLDADGWAWAGVKAFVWLVIIILLLGYIPDRAYYLTVNRTVELGVLASLLMGAGAGLAALLFAAGLCVIGLAPALWIYLAGWIAETCTFVAGVAPADRTVLSVARMRVRNCLLSCSTREATFTASPSSV